jgi:hypothetical protein
MGPFEAQVLTTLFGIGGGLTALIVVTRFWLKKKELEAGGDSQLTHAVEDLRHELRDTRAELTEVQERLDFAERLLTEGRGTGPSA